MSKTDDEAAAFYANPENLRVAGPGRKRKHPNLTSMGSVRFPPEAIEAVKTVASEEGMTVSSWIRRAVRRALEGPALPEPEFVEMTGPEPVRLPAEAVREIVAKLMPLLWKHGTVSLTFGGPQIAAGPNSMTTTMPVSLSPKRPTGLIPGSGRSGEPKALTSSLRLHGTFSCPHMSIGGVASASCGTCGPMRAAA